MVLDGVTQSKIESCQEARRACHALLLRAGHDAKLLADKELIRALAEAVRVTKLSADCLERKPELHNMVLRICVEIAERAALACSKHSDAQVLACGETLATCWAICATAPTTDMAGLARMTHTVACTSAYTMH